jgi:hypothetical protein
MASMTWTGPSPTARTRGFVKVLTPPGRDRILGATIVSAHAGDLLTEFVLAMKHNLGLGKILGTIHIYPTMSEGNRFLGERVAQGAQARERCCAGSSAITAGAAAEADSMDAGRCMCCAAPMDSLYTGVARDPSGACASTTASWPVAPLYPRPAAREAAVERGLRRSQRGAAAARRRSSACLARISSALIRRWASSASCS